jgi:hypothetical protein
MILGQLLKEFFKTPEAEKKCGEILKYGSNCETVIEYGSCGGVSTLALFQALLNGKKKWRPRLFGVDISEDVSIIRLREIAEKTGISFQFWKGHSFEFPVFETDGFFWDTFHCGGVLTRDLERISPYVNKYIFISGSETYGINSEAVIKNMNLDTLTNELHMSNEEISEGLKPALIQFLKKNPEWRQKSECGDLLILERIKSNDGLLFR